MKWKQLITVAVLLLLAGCAGTPHRWSGIPTPKMVVEEAAVHKGASVEWGGEVIAVENRRNDSWVEVLAYPLDSRGWPQFDEPSIGRFMARAEGYLEPAEFEPGRPLRIQGTFSEVRIGKVGEAEYLFPLLEVQKMWLWPKVIQPHHTPIRFGVGVGVRL
jgi:outer membrane lipoprotein